MDKTAAMNLLGKYLDGVKLLVNDPLPDDLPDYLEDVIQSTKIFIENMKSQQLQPKSDETPILNSGRRSRLHKTKKPSTGVQPLVLLERINMKNLKSSIKAGVVIENTSSFKKSKCSTSDKENSKESRNGCKPKSEKCNQKEADRRIHECEDDLYTSIRMSDGCIMN